MVVQLARPVAAGAAFEIDDLTLTGVAVEPGVDALVPAASLDALVGRIAVVDLDAGVLLQRGLWRNGSALRDGERAVGAVLDAGRFPRGLTVGDIVVGDSIADPATSSLDAFVDVGRTDATSTTVVDAPALPAVMRVIDLVALDDGRLSISLAVPIASAIEIARLAATDQLVVVGTLLAEQLATVTPTIGPSP